tara:strand:+ start:120 stop:599 length:480 start_codon:yes stop_codon:yes gene_type:complete
MFDKNKFSFIEINKNIYKIFYDNKPIEINIKNGMIPFGLEKEFNKYLLKIDVNCNDISIIYYIEDLLLNIFNINKDEIKSCIRNKENHNDILICNFKNYKNKIIVNIKYNNKNNYLKTIYDLNKDDICNYTINVESIWYIQDSSNKKAGLNIYVKNINI